MSSETDIAKKRILVVKLSSLGDHFHALPAVHNLKEGLGASVDWVTQPAYRALVECFTDVDRAMVFPRTRFLRNAPSFLKDLRADTYDYIIDLQGLLKSAMVSSWAKGKSRIGPSYAREGAQWLYSAVAGELDQNRHAVDQALDVVRYLDLEETEPVFPLVFPKVKCDQGHPRVALVPASRWPTKNWPVERFMETARALREQVGASLFIVGAPGDEAVCGAIEKGLEGVCSNLCGKTSLVELGSYLQEMDLVITVDSGPMHMAAAVGAPVLAVFGPTDPVRTGPYGEEHRVVIAERTPCWPCRNRTCRACVDAMRSIPAETIVEMALEMLAPTSV